MMEDNQLNELEKIRILLFGMYILEVFIVLILAKIVNILKQMG